MHSSKISLSLRVFGGPGWGGATSIGMWKFPSQGSNPLCHRRTPLCCFLFFKKALVFLRIHLKTVLWKFLSFIYLQKFDVSMFLFQRNCILKKNGLIHTTWSIFKGKNKQYLKAQFLLLSYFKYK